MPWEGIHPHGNNPEQHQYYLDITDPAFGSNWLQSVSPISQNSNSRFMQRQLDLYRSTHGVAPRVAATECGAFLSDNIAQARYLIRRVLSLWTMGVSMVVLYSLAEGGNYRLIDPGGLNPRPSYTALQRMMSLLPSALGAGGPHPPVLGWTSTTWDLMTCTVKGGSGATLFAWQRTEHASSWQTVTSPAAATMTLGDGARVVAATNVRTGGPVVYAVTGDAVAVPVTDDVVAVQFA
jgi:hypothetical protein